MEKGKSNQFTFVSQNTYLNLFESKNIHNLSRWKIRRFETIKINRPYIKLDERKWYPTDKNTTKLIQKISEINDLLEKGVCVIDFKIISGQKTVELDGYCSLDIAKTIILATKPDFNGKCYDPDNCQIHPYQTIKFRNPDYLWRVNWPCLIKNAPKIKKTFEEYKKNQDLDKNVHIHVKKGENIQHEKITRNVVLMTFDDVLSHGRISYNFVTKMKSDDLKKYESVYNAFT